MSVKAARKRLIRAVHDCGFASIPKRDTLQFCDVMVGVGLQKIHSEMKRKRRAERRMK